MRLLSALLFLTVISASAQKVNFGVPVKLDENVNSPAEELIPMLSHDGKQLYFARAFDARNTGGETGGLDIWVSKRELRGGWQKASNQLPVFNNKLSNAVIGVGRAGQTIFLLNSYENKNGIAFSKMINGNWSQPEVIPFKGLAPTGFNGFFMNATFDVLLISMNTKGAVGNEDLYVSLKDSLSNWSRPVNLGPSINSEGFEISPFLSEDKTRLYFASDGHGGYGNADIFVAERLYDNWTIWTQPKNLGKQINSDKFDAYFSTYGDTVSFFASNRGSENSDIYRVPMVTKVDTVNYAKDDITFLTDQQVSKLAPGLKKTMIFKNGSTELTAEHHQILTATGNLMTKNADLFVRLEARSLGDSKNLDENQKRLLSALRFLKTVGIEGSRVTFGSEIDSAQADQGIVVVRFYR